VRRGGRVTSRRVLDTAADADTKTMLHNFMLQGTTNSNGRDYAAQFYASRDYEQQWSSLCCTILCFKGLRTAMVKNMLHNSMLRDIIEQQWSRMCCTIQCFERIRAAMVKNMLHHSMLRGTTNSSGHEYAAQFYASRDYEQHTL